jgi:DNA-binding MarR family transcriptional regulator
MKNGDCPDMPLGRHFAVLAKFYYGALTNKLNHIDLDRYYSILLLLSNSTEPVTQQMISCKLYIDKTSMVRIIDNLVEKHYLKREAKPGDRRCHQIELTDKGRSIIPQIEEAINELNNQMMQDISHTDREKFLHVLAVISRNLQELPGDEIEFEYQKKKSNIINS